MNSLCEAIMNDIDGIEGSCVDAQFAVIEAVVALEEKVIEMSTLSQHNGFVQESKFEDFLVKADEKLGQKPNEKLIKTILLAIPRLLLNLVKLVYIRWRDMSFENRCRRVERDIRELKKLNDEFDDLEEKLLATNHVEFPPGFRMTRAQGQDPVMYITIYVSNIDTLRSSYDKMRDICVDYANAIENGMDKLSDDYVDMTKINADIRGSIERKECHESNPFTNSPPEEYTKIVEFRQYHDTIMKEIENAVKKLEKWVSGHLQFSGDSKGGITKDTAKKLLAEARELYKDFLKNDSLVLGAVDKTITSYANAISWYLAQVQNYAELAKAHADKRGELKKKLDEFKNTDPTLNPDAAIAMVDKWDNPDRNKK